MITKKFSSRINVAAFLATEHDKISPQIQIFFPSKPLKKGKISPNIPYFFYVLRIITNLFNIRIKYIHDSWYKYVYLSRVE